MNGIDAAAVEVVAELADRRSEASAAARHLDPEVAAAIADAGLARLYVPADLGGPEVDPVTAIDLLATVAAGDGAAGWCAMIAGTTSVLASALSPEAAASVWGPARGWAVGTYAPLGKATRDGDGWRATGRWSWGSGSHAATHVLGGCLTDDGGFRLLLFARDDVLLHDDWHATGLQGTGSGDWSVEGAFVPGALAPSAAPLRPVHGGPLGRMPFFGLLAASVAGVLLGIARRAVDEAAALATAKVPQFSSRALATSPLAQVDLARAEALVSSGRAFLLDEVAQAWACALAGDEVPVERRARLRLACTHAATSAAAAVDLCHDLAGGSSVHAASPLGRCHRDVHVATQHLMVSRRMLEAYGRLRAGLDVDTSML